MPISVFGGKKRPGATRTTRKTPFHGERGTSSFSRERRPPQPRSTEKGWLVNQGRRPFLCKGRRRSFLFGSDHRSLGGAPEGSAAICRSEEEVRLFLKYGGYLLKRRVLLLTRRGREDNNNFYSSKIDEKVFPLGPRGGPPPEGEIPARIIEVRRSLSSLRGRFLPWGNDLPNALVRVKK